MPLPDARTRPAAPTRSRWRAWTGCACRTRKRHPPGLRRSLRHQSQRRAALRELYAARAAFARLGAIPFLARCDAELGHEVPTVPMVPSVPAEPPPPPP